jgi:hypothetical protein
MILKKNAWADTLLGAQSSVVGSGAMLQAERSRVQIPMKSLDFFQRA